MYIVCIFIVSREDEDSSSDSSVAENGISSDHAASKLIDMNKGLQTLLSRF